MVHEEVYSTLLTYVPIKLWDRIKMVFSPRKLKVEVTFSYKGESVTVSSITAVHE